MANTVNDVMHVIASPDYGIKSIAGTNQEILAIIQGNSKSQNNIHEIVKDIQSILKGLANSNSNGKKVTEIGDKSPKINLKNIQDILDETKNIRKSIDNLLNAVIKNGGKNYTTNVAKLSNKASEIVADAMVKNIEKQNKYGGLSTIIDTFIKLKDISLKDIIVGKLKLNHINKIFEDTNKNFKIKDNELDNIIKLVNNMPVMIKALGKISWRINKIIENDVIKKLNNILVGRTSLLSLSKTLQNNKNTFEETNITIKSISELSSSLSKIMNKLFFTSLLSKSISNGVQNITFALDKLISLSNKLAKNKNNINEGTEVIKRMTTLVGNLFSVSLFLNMIAVTGVPALLGAKMLSKIIDVITPSVKKLSKNNNHMTKSIGSAIALIAFSGLMVVSSLFLATIAVTGIPALLGAKMLSKIIDVITPSVKKLSKNNKNITKSIGSAIALIAFSGLMVVSSLFLATIAVTGIPALLGAKMLSKIIDVITPSVKKLSKNNKNITKSIGSAIALIAFSGLMVVSSLFLATIAVTGVPALLGSIFIFGIVAVNVITFKILSKSLKNIILGGISMAVMSASLLLFGIALNKINQATKDITWKQFGMIAALTGLFGVAIAILGIPAVAPFIILGGISMAVMSASLLLFGIALNKINQATKGITWKQFGMIAALTGLFGVTIAILGIPVVAPFIILGGISMAVMSVSLLLFGIALNKINQATKDTDNKKIDFICYAIDKFSEKFKKIGGIVTLEIMAGAKSLESMADELHNFINALSKIKNVGIQYKAIDFICYAIDKFGEKFKEIGGPIDTPNIKSGAKSIKIMADNLHNFINALVKINRINLQYKAIDFICYAINKFIYTFKNIPKIKIDESAIKTITNSLNKFIYAISKIKKINTSSTRSLNIITNTLSRFVNVISKLKTFKTTDIVYSAINKYVNLFKKIGNNKNIQNIKSGAYSLKITTSSLSAFIRIIDKFKKNGKFDSVDLLKSMDNIFNFLKNNTLGVFERIKAKNNIVLLRNMSDVMTNISKINTNNIMSIGDALSSTLNGVNAIDMSQITAVTNMFNAFNGINKSENLFNKFTESVNKFTEACNNLMDAMGLNTDAINNSNTNDNEKIITSNIDFTSNASGNVIKNENENKGIRISNVEELANNIADKINGALYVDVPDTQVQLLINGTGGNEWTISRY